jgi:hypothetical protein
MKWKALCFAPLLILGLVACSPASASSGTGQPTMLHVTRTEAFPEYGFAPLDETITDTAAVQQVYQAAYVLPYPPSGIYNCPNDIGLVYHLEFFQPASSVEQMRLNATGCQFLQIGRDDVRSTNEAFRELLRKTLGIPSLVPPIPGRGQP